MRAERVVLSWIKRFASSLILGAVEFAVYVAIFYKIIPALFTSLWGGDVQGGSTVLPVMLAMFALSVSARALAGTIYQPVFRGALVVLGLSVTAAVLGAGTVRVEGVEVAPGTEVSIEVSLEPLFTVMILFLVIPAIVMYFIEFFLWGER